MFKKRAGWQVVVIVMGTILGLLLVLFLYSKIFNKSLINLQKETESDQIVMQLNTLGDSDAKLKIVVLSTYDCGWSRKYYLETIKPFIGIMKKEEDKYRDVSLTYDLIGFRDSSGLIAGQAIYCANEQGKFWEANDILWRLGETGDLKVNYTVENIIKNLNGIGLNTSKLKKCLENKKYESRILEKAQWYLGKYEKLGFPTTFLNGETMNITVKGESLAVGALGLSDFIININKSLNK